MGKTSDKRLKQVLSYKNEHGIDATCEQFGIEASTVRRHERRAKNRELEIEKEFDQPKILVYDLECSPAEAYVWETGSTYINTDKIKKGKALLSWSAKWLCDDEIMSDKVTVEEAKAREDESIIEGLHSLLDECDIALGHNIRSFDNDLANTRFLDNDLHPPSPYQTIDTYRQANKNFNFLSNSLDFISKKLCEDKQDKLDHSMELWHRCVSGDESALEEMREYNEIDCRVVEDIHFELRPFYTSGVNVGLYYDDMGDRCPRCGSENIKESDSHYFTATGKYRVSKCLDCGGFGRSRFCDISTEERKKVKRTLAR